MPKYISMRELDAKAQELGTVGAALRWAKDNGYAVDTKGGFAALPPKEGDAPTGALDLAAKPSAAPPDSAQLAVKSTGGREPMSEMQRLRADILAYPGQQAARRKADFEQGQQNIAQMYAGPSRSQQLFALSKALLSPKPYRGFAGTMVNISGALSDISTAQDEARRKRAQAELELQKAYGAQTADSDYEALKLRYQLASDEAEAMAKANKPPRTGFNPITGKLTDMDTGLPVAPPPPRLGEVRDGYMYIGGNPASQKSWKKV